ncbi:hypothetical protein LOZ58_002782 [Ophidiomyces ophidiicola]|nr:hypothetical protein LOZ65_004819 [Ophidiomyces ophidiicola]KAI1962440.1 hypothetical protein LOZ58_002782 [Ophidiomyces ophidiicola]
MSALTIQEVSPSAKSNLTFRTLTNNEAMLEKELPIGHIMVEFLASAINPQDLLVMQGKYPVKPSYQVDGAMVVGYDGVARVTRVGSGAELSVGDLVIPAEHGLGTWRTHAVVRSCDLTRIPPDIDPCAAAILRMGVSPAYLILEDMAHLLPGDWIIQNAASGVIAQMVVQFAKLKGANVVSIIRPHSTEEETNKLKRVLQENGSNIVLDEKELDICGGKVLKDLRITLALDAVFGRAGSTLTKFLVTGATFVNYGSLGEDAQQGLMVTQEALFWKRITFKNFRLSDSLKQRSSNEIKDMLSWFVDLFARGLLKLPYMKRVEWDPRSLDLENTLKRAVFRAESKQAGIARKQVFVFRSG